MPSYVPPKKATELILYVGLESVATAGAFQANATLANGDVTVSKDGATAANITTLPTVTPTGGKRIKVTLSATEMDADNVCVLFSDASGGEWRDLMINIPTAARQVDDLAYPTTSGRSIDVTAGGEVGIDWANIGSPTATVNFSGSTVAAVSGAVGSVSGAVGSVTGNVGGNVVGSVASVVGSVTVGTNNDKTGYSLSSGGVQAIWDALTSALTTSGSVGKRIADNLDAAVTSRSTLTAAGVWDALISGISTANSIGKRIVDNLDVVVSTRLASGSYTAPDNSTIGTINTKLGTPTGVSLSADVAAVKGDTAAILDDTGTSGVIVASGSKTGYSLASDQSGVTVGTVNALGTQAKADVNAEVLDVFNVDTFAEPTSVPAATSSLRAKIGWMFKVLRNRMTQTSTTQTLYADDGTTADNTSTTSDNGSVFTRGEWS